MSDALRDQNRIPNVIVVDTNGNPAHLKVDPITGELLISVYDGSGGGSSRDVSHRDSNRIPVGLVDNSDDGMSELTIDSANGYLLIENDL